MIKLKSAYTAKTVRRACSITLLCLITLGTWSCGPTEHAIEWQIVFADDDLRDRAVAVEAYLLEGGCTSAEVLYRVELIRGETSPRPPRLPTGRYGFVGEARDHNCRWFAGSCLEAALPEQGPTVTVTLEESTGRQQCPVERCQDGFCQDAPDADVEDADVDDADVADTGVADADLQDAEVCDADFEDADVTDADGEDADVSDVEDDADTDPE